MWLAVLAEHGLTLGPGRGRRRRASGRGRQAATGVVASYGAATFEAYDSVNVSGNSGITFKAAVPYPFGVGV